LTLFIFEELIEQYHAHNVLCFHLEYSEIRNIRVTDIVKTSTLACT